MGCVPDPNTPASLNLTKNFHKLVLTKDIVKVDKLYSLCKLIDLNKKDSIITEILYCLFTLFI